jgi:hypothetical protein
MVGPWGRVTRRGAAARRLFLHENHASSKLIRSFPAALQSIECVLRARLRSGRLVGPAVACLVSSLCSSPLWARVLWRALAGGSSNQVSLRSGALHWGGRGWSLRLHPLRAIRTAPAAIVPASCVVLDRRRCSLRMRCSVRLRLTDQPRVFIGSSWRLLPRRMLPSACSYSRTAGRQRAASAS